MDMLVKLYEVHDDFELYARLREKGITLKRAMAPDLTKVQDFVRENFSEGWVNECTVGLIKNHCWIAVKEQKVVGFACYDTTMPDYFGPTGVLEELRGLGIGKALLLRSLMSLKEMGYAYAIIGWAGPVKFYEKAVGATVIEGSIPKSYRNMVAVDGEF